MFTDQTLAFLADLEENNDRDWFNANRPRYDAHVKDAALELITSLQAPLGELSPHLKVVPKVQGGSLFRIHRDTRFSKDKTPYKTHVAMRFEHLGGTRERPGPGLYFQVSAHDAGLGGGLWHPPNPVLQDLRAAMVADRKRWTGLRDELLASGWEWMGSSLKRVPRGFDADDPLAEDLKRKDLAMRRSVSHAQVTARDLPDHLATEFAAAAPLLEWMSEALGLPF